ncbi:TniQ family protein [Rhizobium leguminosarum]|uniref:TniQ family protein n=1 Tax=Rhizobium leguminosarum TaxID=384 RepID=UPI001C988396|nr:TniQ family protein [Rhizobium leguminosarum]MBY5399515.1 TniQ family protein [Rhizobium leguminosarum]
MLYVPLLDQECLTSFCARFAAANFTTATELCLDMGIRFQNVVDGSDEAIEALAEYGRVAPERLRQSAVRGVGGSVNVDGEVFARKNYARTRLRFCPECFREDDRSADRMPGTRRYTRRIWPIRFLRTCPQHSCRIVDLGVPPLSSPRFHDFMEAQEAMYDDLEDAMAITSSRSPSGFELFLLRRLRAVRDNGPLLDAMPLELAAFVCELAGVSDLFGAKTAERSLDEDQLWAAGQRGYEYLSAGVPGLHSYLDVMHSRLSAVRCDVGGQKIYGRFYTILKDHENPALLGLKREIHDYAVRVLPLSGDSEVFGRPSSTRYLSEKQLRDQFAIRPGHMRKMAVAAGLLDPSEIAAGAMPREVASSIAASLSDAVLPAQAAELIGVNYTVFKSLRRAGLFSPLLSSGNGVAARERFSRAALLAFVDEIERTAERLSIDGLDSIIVACKKTSVKFSEIVALLQQKRLKVIGWNPGQPGLAAVMIDPAEVEEALAPCDNGSLQVEEMKAKLVTSNEAISVLLRGGYLRSTVERLPPRFQPRRVISRDDAEIFTLTYVSFLGAEREYGVRRKDLRMAIQRYGLEPAFPVDEVRVSFYVREKLEAALKLVR